MLTAARRNKILEILKEKREVTTSELEKEFDVTGATIRSDLSELEAKGFIKRIHGGAVLPEKNLHNFDYRNQKNIEEKTVIGKKASGYVKEDQTIFLDASSTMLYFLPYIDKVERLTVVTNGVYAALEAKEYENIINVILLGGILRSHSGAIEGLLSEAMLSEINGDIIFVSADGFTVEDGLTIYNFYESELKRRMVNKCKKVIALLDYTKIGKTSSSSFLKSEEIDLIITDNKTSSDDIKKIKDAGIDIVVSN